MHRQNFRIYYEDTDAGGVVYYANYLKFAERARSEFLRDAGFENSKLRKDFSIGFVVRSIQAEYHSPARLDDIIQIETVLTEIKNSSFIMKQSIFSDERLLFTMNVRLACIGNDFRPARMPIELRGAFYERRSGN